MDRSPQWRDGRFRNPQPLWNDMWGAIGSLFRRDRHSTPRAPLPVAHPTRADLEAPASSSPCTASGRGRAGTGPPTP